ncbi:MAG: 3-alpha-hydroxysteroid dehydrogenase [Actinomycetia bacterium]|nr:3-alpha-hydroxysteroid dehydrogenase [Actinomycetes bacterium]
MRDALGYAGKRVIVAGAASEVGLATVEILVELGAEVHAIADHRPEQPALASFTDSDLGDPGRIESAFARIGSVVNAFFDCHATFDLDRLQAITERVVPLMVDGAIAGVVSAAGAAWVREMAATLLATTPSVRVNGVLEGSGEAPYEVAWPLVFLNSTRASGLTGAALPLR